MIIDTSTLPDISRISEEALPLQQASLSLGSGEMGDGLLRNQPVRLQYDAPLHQQYISFSGEPHPFPTLELSTGNRVMRRRNTGKEAKKRGVHGTRDQEQGTSN
jgi:hypothetical protein